MPIIDIREGNINAYVIPAVGVLIVGLILTVFIWIIGLPVIIFAITLFFIRSGIQIDSDKRVYRNYADYMGRKFGAWHSLPASTEVVLQLSVESRTMRNFMMGGTGRNFNNSGTTTMKSITYDIVLTDELGHKRMFYEFLKYKAAQQALLALSETLGIDYTDKVAQKLEENREKRARR